MVLSDCKRHESIAWAHKMHLARVAYGVRVARRSLYVARSSSLREQQQSCKAWIKRALFLQRICNFCLKTSKNRWICLILSKNRWFKYRFFALFRLTTRGQSKDGGETLNHTKTHLGEAPRCVRCALLPGLERVTVAACSRHSLQRVTVAAHSWHGSQRATRSALVDTSVHLQPAELVNVTLDVLARLAPCLNLRVGELGHKDLLDTVGAKNCRK